MINFRSRAAAFVASLAVFTAAAVFSATPAMAATTYHYARGVQSGVVADGAAVNLTVENPYIDSSDGAGSHSLAELIVQSADLQQGVEVGWRKASPTGTVKLFVYHRVNGVGQGYDLCTDYASEPRNAGADITSYVGAVNSPRFQITNTGTAWWIAFDLKWVCYIPNTVWSSASPPVTFNKANTVQAYGEYASTVKAKPCGDMGNGQDASSGTAARIGSFSLVNPTPVVSPSLTVSAVPSGAGITTSVLSPTTFRYGWKGYSSTGTLPGTTGGC